MKTSDENKKKIDLNVAKSFYTCNISFNVAESGAFCNLIHKIKLQTAFTQGIGRQPFRFSSYWNGIGIKENLKGKEGWNHWWMAQYPQWAHNYFMRSSHILWTQRIRVPTKKTAEFLSKKCNDIIQTVEKSIIANLKAY